MTVQPRMPRSALGAGVAIMIAVAVLAFSSDLVLLSLHFRPAYAAIDAVLLGCFCGAITWAYEDRHHRFLAEKLYIIAEMNHRVRNDLQVIRYSAHFTHNKEHIERISECLGHIEWALREVLPGKEFPAPQPDQRAAGQQS